MPKRVRVLIVDDSALIRQLLSELFSRHPLLEVVGSASDPHVAREKIKQLNPDVITLDIEMPRMDGLTFLANLMRLHPMPVVMVSSLTSQGAEATIKALELGAVDFISKPRLDVREQLGQYSAELIEKVLTASRVSQRHLPPARVDTTTFHHAPLVMNTTDKIIALGASTGGTEAIKTVLLGMPADCPGIVIVQHIPAAFSAAFAERMNRLCQISVREASHGDRIQPGLALVAPGGRHLTIARDGAHYVCRLDDKEEVNRHRPSVDKLFLSVVVSAGQNAAAALLTGMGEDGAAGLLAMRHAGLHTIAQDEASSVVWGMPGEAVKRGAAAEVLPLPRISRALLEVFQIRAARKNQEVLL
jgi:two-component system, chemotaxis family, protein-glutamate methylesterase/glutaminase